MKKIMFLFSFSLCMLVFSNNVSAAGLTQFKMTGDDEVNKGDTIELDIVVNNGYEGKSRLNYDMTAFSFYYDPTVFEFVSFDGKGIFKRTFSEDMQESFVSFSDYGEYWADEGEVISTVKLKVKEDATIDNTKISWYTTYEYPFGEGYKTIILNNKKDNNDVSQPNNNKSDSSNEANESQKTINMYLSIGLVIAAILILGLLISLFKRR